ncbi:MAG: primosomal protein N' family DNA-binding protein [Ferrimicrobium sp.]
MPSRRSLGSKTVEVVVEIVGRPGPYRYRWPEAFESPQPGDEVVVELQTRRVAAWVVGSGTDDGACELKPVLRLRRPGISSRLLDLALASARWYVCSPVYFLRKLRSPRVRDAAKVRATRSIGMPGSSTRLDRGPGGDSSLTDGLTGATSFGSRSEARLPPSIAPIDLIWHSLGASSVEMALVLLRQRRGVRGIIVCPTLRQRTRMLQALLADGFLAGDVDVDWARAAIGEIDLVVAGRYGAFAPIDGVEVLVVLDPIDPSMREQATPGADGLELARLRAGLEGIPVTVITAAPPLSVVAVARIYREPFGVEAKRWPSVGAVQLSDVDPSRGVVGTILDRSHALDESRSPRLAVIVPSTGWSGWLRCRSCHVLQRCGTCQASLAPINLDIERPGLSHRLALVHRGLVLAGMYCPTCAIRLPLRCVHCSGTQVTTTALSAERVRALLAGATHAHVELVTGDEMPSADAQYVVGGYGLLDRIERCGAIALVNLEQFWGVSSLAGLPMALYYFNRGASIASRVLVCSDGSAEALLSSLESRNVRPLYRSELASRRHLGLPPATAIVRIHGQRVKELVDAQAPEVFAGLEVIAESETSYLVVGASSYELHERLASGEWPTESRACRFTFDLLEL